MVLDESLGAPKSLEPQRSDYRVRLSLQVADEEFILRKPVIFWKCGRCSRLYTGEYGGDIQNVWQKEWVYAVKEKDLLNMISWPINLGDSRRYRVPFVGQVLWTRKEDKTGSSPIHEVTECLVWVTLRIYHFRKSGEESREWLERDVHVCIYQKPDMGFRQLCENTLPTESQVAFETSRPKKIKKIHQTA